MPSCTSDGYTINRCSCGNSYQSDEVDALGHIFSPSGICSRCGYDRGGAIIVPTQPTEPSEPESEVMSLSGDELVSGCVEYIQIPAVVTHDYIYASGKLLRETITTTVDGEVTDTDVLDFYYDQNGRPYAFTHNGSMYYYVLNLQGDVVDILDSSGSRIAYYIYNAWGEIITQSGTMADINPIRYRGYYYDTELEMYYLQSRYYDPSICRFVNSDAYASTGQGFVGYNMFAYCNNTPVNGSDACGNCLHRIDFLNDCEQCGGKTFAEKWNEFITTTTDEYQKQVDLTIQITIYQVEAIQQTIKTAAEHQIAASELDNLIRRQQVDMVNDFMVERFSTPEKAANSISTISWGLRGAGIWCMKKGLKRTAFVLEIVSFALDGVVEFINAWNEET